MVKIYTKTIILFLLAFGIKAKAQCGPCNTTISGLSTSDRYVGAGQTLCISATGTVTGNIYVGQAGNLCNAGTINSDSVIVDDGGSFLNYKNINSRFVSVFGGGFYNGGIAAIDSFIITQQYSYFLNDSIFSGNFMSIKDHLSATNNGTISVNNFRDSIISFTNNGHIHVNHNLKNESSSNFTNNGTIYIGNDFLNDDMSNFNCNNYMEVQHDFINSSAATFTTNCMLTVNNDWHNSGFVYGPSVGCGGFHVTGVTFSSAYLGMGGTYLDICDAGHPASGIDYPWGGVDPTTTFCTCTNLCTSISTDIKEKLKGKVDIIVIFPNPCSTYLTIKLNNQENDTLKLEIRDMMGKTLFSKSIQASIDENETVINVSNLSQGTYILKVTDSCQLQTNRLFTVVK